MKQNIIIYGLMALMFLSGLWLWLTGPAYARFKVEQREAVRQAIILTYYMQEYAELRQQLTEKYGFTDDDINPGKILENVLSKECH